MDLFRTEVPEISEGIVNIMGASREPGVRAKIAVASNNSDIDPVGACVGMKGSRVQNVVQELRGEKIDIIPWHVDPAKFVCNALAPAEISRVIIDESNNTMEVIVPDEFLSIAIGKRGQNVRLASKLTNWHLDVKSETLYSQAMQSGYDSLVALPGVGISLADALYESGFYSVEEIAKANIDDLTQIRGIGEEKAVKLMEAAEAAEAAAANLDGETAEDEPDTQLIEDGNAAADESDDQPIEDKNATVPPAEKTVLSGIEDDGPESTGDDTVHLDAQPIVDEITESVADGNNLDSDVVNRAESTADDTAESSEGTTKKALSSDDPEKNI